MKVDIHECRQKLPLPDLMGLLGLGDAARKSAKCIFHEDKTPSFGIYKVDGRDYYKCFGCGVHGDEVALLEWKFGINTKEAIKKYGEIAGMNIDDIKSVFPNATPVKEPAPVEKDRPKGFMPPRLQALTGTVVEQVAKWRGYTKEFVEEMAGLGVLGMHGRKIAFPVKDGLHYRVQEGWRYTEFSIDTLFVLGKIEEGASVHVFESQWDALAFAMVTGYRDNIVATRGANKVHLLVKALTGHTGMIYVWSQNDKPRARKDGTTFVPSEIWAREVRTALPYENLSRPLVPNEREDMNDWVQNGGDTQDVLNALMSARLFPVATEDTFETPVDGIATPPDSVSLPGTAPDTGAIEAEWVNEGPPALPEREQSFEEYLRTPELPSLPSGGALIVENLPVDTQPLEGAADASPVAGEVPKSVKGEPAPVIAPDLGSGHTPYDLGGLLHKLTVFLSKYVSFSNDEQPIVVALWLAHAWTFEQFRFSPYLHVCSPEKRCGKTRLLECLQLLVPRPRSFIKPTEAVLFRTIEKHKPTLLLDEIDTIFSKEADDNSEGLRAVLNAGFQKGSVIPRCIGNDHDVKDFHIYCPKVVAGIGRIPDTVKDRSIDIRLVRQTKETAASRLRDREAQAETAPLNQELKDWSAGCMTLEDRRPELPEEISDRQQDMTEPLLAIAEEAGGDWPEIARWAVIKLCKQEDDQSVGVQLLKDMRNIFLTFNATKLPSRDMVHALVKVEDANSPWALWENDISRGLFAMPFKKLATYLEGFKIRPRNMRDQDDHMVKGYYKSDFDDAWKRYLESPDVVKENMEFDL